VSLQRKINKFWLIKKPVFKTVPYDLANELPTPRPMTGFPGRAHGKSILLALGDEVGVKVRDHHLKNAVEQASEAK